jgi:lipopolysaccharide transport protein LptA
MAIFFPDLRAVLAAGLLCVAQPGTAAPPPRADAHVQASDQAIDVEASSSLIDSRTNRLTLPDVTISQGSLRIQADNAVADGTRLSFEDSRWEFSGNVRIHFETGSLTAAQASVRFVGNRIAEAQATGAPAEFEQKLASMSRPVHGHAGKIDFDFLQQTVRLSEDAWFFDGRNEMTSQVVIYNIKEQLAQTDSAPGGTGRVHITIRPESPAEPVAPQPPSGRQ